MKKTINFILIIMMLLLNTMSVFASNTEVKVYVNDKLCDAYINTDSLKEDKIESFKKEFERIGIIISWDEINKCLHINTEVLATVLDKDRIEEFVAEVFEHWFSNNDGTVKPLPTNVPAPTARPTQNPTPIPTKEPTSVPTVTQTPAPIQTPVPTQPPSTSGEASNELANEVFKLVNAERAKYGLSALKYNSSLESVAYAHSKDMADNGYFSHTNLKGQSPFDRIRSAGISYSRAAENIAAGQQSAESVMSSWMNSQGHRENILNPDLTEIGIGVYKGGSYGIYWTQLFITK